MQWYIRHVVQLKLTLRSPRGNSHLVNRVTLTLSQICSIYSEVESVRAKGLLFRSLRKCDLNRDVQCDVRATVLFRYQEPSGVGGTSDQVDLLQCDYAARNLSATHLPLLPPDPG